MKQQRLREKKIKKKVKKLKKSKNFEAENAV